MSEEQKQITLYVPRNDLALIDSASKKDKRSRSSFLIISGIERAKEILKQNE